MRDSDAAPLVNITEHILTSYLKIDQAVSARRPVLRHVKYRTVRDYITHVMAEFKLDKGVCELYVELYEHVRYGSCAMPNNADKVRIDECVAQIMSGIESS